MDKNKIIEIAKDVESKSNKDLNLVKDELYIEFDKTKNLIIDLTRHLESVEVIYNKVNDEINKRKSK